MLAQLRKLLNAQWLVRLRQDRSVREALFVFVLTRSVIFAILICVGNTNVITYQDTPTPVREAFTSLKNVSVARKLRDTMWRADVAHYMDISRDGYLNAPFDVNNARSRAFAFFPLHPLLLWIIRNITNDVMLWGAAMCNLFFLIALVLLHKLTLSFGYDEVVAGRTLFYLATFPVSYFFSVPLTESLFVMLTVASFYAAKKEHWWTAGIIGMFASASRVNGVLLLPALIVLSWQMYRSLQIRKIIGLALIPFGLFAYMFYSWWLSGDAWAFRHAVAYWGRKPSWFFPGVLIKWLISPYQIAEPWNINILNVGAALLCFVCVYILVRRREWALALYTFMSIVLPLSSGMLQSLDRYAMGFFPVFIALGLAVKTERQDQTIRYIFAMLLGLMTVLFAANYTIAVS